MRRPCEDPLAEYTRGITPYSYCYNNPVRYIDPLGMVMMLMIMEHGIMILLLEDGKQ